MSWNEVSTMQLREEFVSLARREDANLSRLCQRFGISRPTGYKWLARRATGQTGWAADQSRRPRTSPGRTPAAKEAAVLEVRQAHPAWGGRKIRAVLLRRGQSWPAPSTITAILHRHGRIDPDASRAHRPCQRFEHAAPNDLWQMDFKGDGDALLANGRRAQPLTVLDDHSRYVLEAAACPDQRAATVRRRLEAVFRRYGLPRRMLMDNGSCWGVNAEERYTILSAWLIRLGVAIAHGRPYHPQTQGKVERLHGTLKAELLATRRFAGLEDCQAALDAWRTVYNHERPHEALGLATPASRYQVSALELPEILPPIQYGPGDAVRKVNGRGAISFEGSRWHVGRAFCGLPVAVRPTLTDGRWNIYFCHQAILAIDLRTRQHDYPNQLVPTP
jgi:transposase InsO family protein